jgi:hypothetical protein
MAENVMRSIKTGGCMCGAVRYRVDGPLRPIVVCHCEQCRRMTGHFMAATAAKRGTFELEGADSVVWYSASSAARRGFCKHCGSTLFWDGVDRDYISVAAGTLDNSEGLKIVCHIFVSEKGGYYDIEDGARLISDGQFVVDFPAS